MNAQLRQALGWASLFASVVFVGAGLLGMALSFLYLASASMADITAGAAGFVAAAVLLGAGLLSLTLLATRGEPGKTQSSAAE